MNNLGPKMENKLFSIFKILNHWKYLLCHNDITYLIKYNDQWYQKLSVNQ